MQCKSMVYVCLMSVETITVMPTNLMVDNDVWIPTNWTGVPTYLVSSLQKQNLCKMKLHTWYKEQMQGGLKIKILLCRFCESSVAECLPCGSSCIIPTLDWFHTFQCTLSGEINTTVNTTVKPDITANNETWFSLTYLHSPGNPRACPCSERVPQQPELHPHEVMLLCSKSDLEVQAEGDPGMFLQGASAKWTERKRQSLTTVIITTSKTPS